MVHPTPMTAYVFGIKAIGAGVVSLRQDMQEIESFTVAQGPTVTLWIPPPGRIPEAETASAFTLHYVPRPGASLKAIIAWDLDTASHWIEQSDPDRPVDLHAKAVGMFTTHGNEGL